MGKKITFILLGLIALILLFPVFTGAWEFEGIPKGKTLSHISLIMTAIMKWLFDLIIISTAVAIVIGGIFMASSSGNPGRIDTGKKVVLYAAIGLIIAAMARILVYFVYNIIMS